LKKALTEFTDENILKDALKRAKDLNINEPELIQQIEKHLEKRTIENALIEKFKNALSNSAIPTPQANLNYDLHITDFENLIKDAQQNKPYFFPLLGRIVENSEILLLMRKAYVTKKIEELSDLLKKNQSFPDLPETDELENMRKFVEIQEDINELIKKMKQAILKKSKDLIMDLLAQGKLLKIQWDPELFKQAMEIIKRQSEIVYYKEKARTTKTIGLINLAIEKAEQYDPNDPDIPELHKLSNSVKDINEECLVALNVLEKPQMEEVLNKAKSLEITNDLIDTLQMLLYDMDDYSFEELQFKVALKLGDKKLLLKRLMLKKKREIFESPNAAIMFSFEKIPILQDPIEWSKKSFLSDMFGSEERKDSFLKWTQKKIHKPLSKITDKKLVEESCEIFKNIMCVMGDMEHKAPINCAQSIIHSGIHNGMLRDEIYLQIMKQLINNPKPDSVDKGWMLMAYCLRAFAPVATQNYVDYFIRSKAKHPEQLLVALYNKVMFEQANFMQLNEIRAMLAYFFYF